MRRILQFFGKVIIVVTVVYFVTQYAYETKYDHNMKQILKFEIHLVLKYKQLNIPQIYTKTY